MAALELVGLSKTFPGQVALSGVDFSVSYGEVHALVGQNGSGKSTLIKILAGYHQADPGCNADCNGERFALGNAQAAKQAGLRFVHQDLGLVLSMTVLENVMLGRQYPVGVARRILWRQTAERVRRYLKLLGVEVEPDTRVSALSMAERTGVAIARAVSETEGKKLLIVLDEPTAALPAADVDRLLEIIDRLRSEGHGVVLVSHHLNEVLRIADRVTVLRDGRVVASVERAQLDYDKLTEFIVGHAIAPSQPAIRDKSEGSLKAPAVLQIDKLAGARLIEMNLDVQAGEVVGVAGITGSGRESVAPLLSGRLPFVGTVLIGGERLVSGDPARALKQGLAQIPGERARYGLFMNLSVRANMTVSDLRRHRHMGRVRTSSERAEVQNWIDKLGIVTRSTEAPVSTLSGGNQQKVLVGRALRLTPRVLVLDDPTFGIDIGARHQIHGVIEKCAEDGMAIVLVSTDSDELARLSDRVVILANGRVAQCLHRGPELTAASIDISQLASAKPLVAESLPGETNTVSTDA